MNVKFCKDSETLPKHQATHKKFQGRATLVYGGDWLSHSVNPMELPNLKGFLCSESVRCSFDDMFLCHPSQYSDCTYVLLCHGAMKTVYILDCQIHIQYGSEAE